MRVFWHEGGLHVHPESEHEGRMLVEFVDHLKFEKPPEMHNCIPGGETTSGSEGLFDALVGSHQSVPSSLPGKADDKKHVVCIDKLL